MFSLPCCTLHVKDTWSMFIDKTLITPFSLVLWENQVHLESIKKQLALRELLMGDTQVMTCYLSFLRKSRIKHLIREFFSFWATWQEKKKLNFFSQGKIGTYMCKVSASMFFPSVGYQLLRKKYWHRTKHASVFQGKTCPEKSCHKPLCLIF